MNERRIVLVTGVTSQWGSRVAEGLLAQAQYDVIGLDAEYPAEEMPGLTFVQTDIRNPLLVDLFKANNVDTVCHLAFTETRRHSEAAFDLNVMGTVKVMGACAAAGVRKIVLRSSTSVYGARASNSAFLTEDHPPRGSQRPGSIRDMAEIEAFCDDFRHRTPEVLVTILRFASPVGPTVDTAMTRFLKEPLAPSLLGFDPMMQIVHEDDVVKALIHAVLHDLPGAYNVAAEDVLPLSKIRGLAGKPPVPIFHKFAYWGAALPGGTARFLDRCLPIEPEYIRFPWVGDLTRMREGFGFKPTRTAEETLREFAQRTNPERVDSRATVMAAASGPQVDIVPQPGQAGDSNLPTTSNVGEGVADV